MRYRNCGQVEGHVRGVGGVVERGEGGHALLQQMHLVERLQRWVGVGVVVVVLVLLMVGVLGLLWRMWRRLMRKLQIQHGGKHVGHGWLPHGLPIARGVGSEGGEIGEIGENARVCGDMRRRRPLDGDGGGGGGRRWGVLA